MVTQIALMTAEQSETLPHAERWELLDGVMIEMSPPGAQHGGIAVRIVEILGPYVRTNHLGRLFVETGYILRRGPDTVRAPDVSFVRSERIPPGGVPRSFWNIPPDLAIEINSPDNTTAEMQARIRDFLEAGARLVWVMYPGTRTIQVIQSLLERREFGPGDTLEGGDVIPGFSCPVAAFFE